MVKKTTTIKLDEDVLQMAREDIPNLSNFIETCLRKYLGLDEEFNIKQIQDEVNQIKNANLNIHLLSEKQYDDDLINEIAEKKCNDAWIKIWGHYRSSGMYPPRAVLKASKILNVSNVELIQIMKTLKDNLTKEELLHTDDWFYCKGLYKELEK